MKNKIIKLLWIFTILINYSNGASIYFYNDAIDPAEPVKAALKVAPSEKLEEDAEYFDFKSLNNNNDIESKDTTYHKYDLDRDLYDPVSNENEIDNNDLDKDYDNKNKENVDIPIDENYLNTVKLFTVNSDLDYENENKETATVDEDQVNKKDEKENDIDEYFTAKTEKPEDIDEYDDEVQPEVHTEATTTENNEVDLFETADSTTETNEVDQNPLFFNNPWPLKCKRKFENINGFLIFEMKCGTNIEDSNEDDKKVDSKETKDKDVSDRFDFWGNIFGSYPVISVDINQPSQINPLSQENDFEWPQRIPATNFDHTFDDDFVPRRDFSELDTSFDKNKEIEDLYTILETIDELTKKLNAQKKPVYSSDDYFDRENDYVDNFYNRNYF